MSHYPSVVTSVEESWMKSQKLTDINFKPSIIASFNFKGCCQVRQTCYISLIHYVHNTVWNLQFTSWETVPETDSIQDPPVSLQYKFPWNWHETISSFMVSFRILFNSAVTALWEVRHRYGHGIRSSRESTFWYKSILFWAVNASDGRQSVRSSPLDFQGPGDH